MALPYSAPTMMEFSDEDMEVEQELVAMSWPSIYTDGDSLLLFQVPAM